MKRIALATRWALICAAIWGVSAFSPATPLAAQGIALTQEQIATVRQINSYINGLSSLKGRFTQLGPNAEFTEGAFYLQRPGRMRFEYAPPNPTLVIADGFWVGIEDRALRSTQKYPLATTPLSLLLDEKVDLLKEARIVGFEDRDGEIALTVEAKSSSTPGRLTLIFGGPNFALKQWKVLDAQGLTTEVAVFDLVSGLRLDPKLFWIDDNLIFETDQR